MTDKIVDGDTVEWGRPANAGTTKYFHLLDGNARKLDIADYGHTSTTNFLVVLRKTARERGFTCRTKTIDGQHVYFQVTGKLNGC